MSTISGYTFDYNLANQVISKDVSDVAMIYGYGADKNETYTTNGLNQYPSIIQDGTNYTLTYDGNGSLLGDGTWTYSYDVENRLLTATGPGVAATYAYDPLGRRAAKSGTGLAPEVYLSDGVEEIADYDGAGILLRRYVHGPGIDEPLLMTVHDGAGVETDRQYYHADHLGSVVAMSDAAGAIADTYTYSAWGEVADPSGNPFRFTGRRLDAETGLYYYRARYYSSAIGRFLQTDPIGYDDDMNMYAYVANDPVNGKDPSGKVCAQCVTGAVGAGVGFLFGAVTSAINEFSKDEDDRNFGNVLKDGLKGAVVGGVIGATGNPVLGAKVAAGLGFVDGAATALADGETPGEALVTGLVQAGLEGTATLAGGKGALTTGGIIKDNIVSNVKSTAAAVTLETAANKVPEVASSLLQAGPENALPRIGTMNDLPDHEER